MCCQMLNVAVPVDNITEYYNRLDRELDTHLHQDHQETIVERGVWFASEHGVDSSRCVEYIVYRELLGGCARVYGVRICFD